MFSRKKEWPPKSTPETDPRKRHRYEIEAVLNGKESKEPFCVDQAMPDVLDHPEQFTEKERMHVEWHANGCKRCGPIYQEEKRKREHKEVA